MLKEFVWKAYKHIVNKAFKRQESRKMSRKPTIKEIKECVTKIKPDDKLLIVFENANREYLEKAALMLRGALERNVKYLLVSKCKIIVIPKNFETKNIEVKK